MHQAKLRRPPAPRLLVALGQHGHGDSRFLFNNGLKLPGFGAHESVCWSFRIVFLGTKPGKADRNSSSNCLTILPARLRAQKKHLTVFRWLPGGHLGAVQIHLAFCARTSDLDSRHSAVTLANPGYAPNSETAIEFWHH